MRLANVRRNIAIFAGTLTVGAMIPLTRLERMHERWPIFFLSVGFLMIVHWWALASLSRALISGFAARRLTAAAIAFAPLIGALAICFAAASRDTGLIMPSCMGLLPLPLAATLSSAVMGIRKIILSS